ncbi:MAG: histidinol dehydrogenase [Saprospiraceae bacterium]
MQIVLHPDRADWVELLRRPAKDIVALEAPVRATLQAVAQRGDAALRELTARFDGVELTDLRVPSEQLLAAEDQLGDELKDAIRLAYENIKTFHAAQVRPVEVVATMPGVNCWRRQVAIDRVGLYIPGGTAPLFSTVLMLAVPALLAGCKQIVLCSPPTHGGGIHPAVLWTAQLCGITDIFQLGGAQAIAALAYGTESVPPVDKIFGPGNAYVTVAKQLVSQGGPAIDMPAGPSEVLVCADAAARPAFVAADLLSQAEHGPDSQVILVCFAEEQAHAIVAETERQLAVLPRREAAAASMANSRAFVVADRGSAADLINAYAPEHLILAMNDARSFSEKITNAGSVFLGHFTPESVGDYASGTNHTLPTYGYARSYSGVSLDSFVKQITYQEVSREGLEKLGPSVMTMAEAEQLSGHARAVAVRLEEMSKD